MNRLLQVTMLALLATVPVHGNISRTGTGSADASASSSSIVTTATTVAQGETLIIGINWSNDGVTVSSVSGTGGDTGVQCSGAANTVVLGGNDAGQDIWYIPNATASSSYQVTVSLSGAGIFRGVIFHRLRGVAPSSACEDANFGQEASAALATTGSFTTAASGNYNFCIGHGGPGSPAWSAGTDYTLVLGTNVNVSQYSQERLDAPSGSQTGSMDKGYTGAYTQVACATLKPWNCTNGIDVGTYTVCGTGYQSVGTATSITATYTPTTGNGILAFATYFPTAINITAITDQDDTALSCMTASSGTKYVNSAHTASDGDDDEAWYAWYCPSIPALTGVKVALSGSTDFGDLLLLELDSSAIRTSGFWDNEAVATSTVEGETASVSITNDNPRNLMVTYQHNGWPTFPPPTGTYPPVTGDAAWTTVPTAMGFNNVLQMKAVTSSQSLDPTSTWTGDLAWFALVWGLKAPVTVQTPGPLQSPGPLQTPGPLQAPF